MNIHRYPLELSFKGERDYLQGPDIFDAALAMLHKDLDAVQAVQIDFAFHRLARHAVDLVNDDQGKTMNPVAVCQYSVGGLRRQAYVIETEREVSQRTPYLEEEIVARMAIDLERHVCALDAEMRYTDMELWVSMTKALHKAILPDLNGKWLFVRARFEEYEEDAKGPRALVFKSNFNNKLTRCEALRDGVKVGEIYFSIV